MASHRNAPQRSEAPVPAPATTAAAIAAPVAVLAASVPAPASKQAPTRRRCRHWRETWSAIAPLVWNRNLLFNGRRHLAGEPLDQQDRALLPVAKLRRWWDNQVFARADVDAHGRVLVGQS